ncbi:MAG TPA: SPOR domain-containing protein, partial [Pelomicrobium sp.]|nr:SPOR domain-containing protein [Pelomicrobium sp.]
VVADSGAGVLLLGADTAVRLWLPAREPLPGVDRRFALLVEVRQGAVRFSARGPAAGAPGGLLVQTRGLSAGLAGGEAALRADPPAACLVDGQLLVQRDTRLMTLDERGACVGGDGGWIGAIDLAPGAGTVGGGKDRWTVNVASPQAKAEADALAAALGRDGYAAEVLPVLVQGRQHYRVRFTGVAGKAEARALAERIPAKHTRGKPWIAPEE